MSQLVTLGRPTFLPTTREDMRRRGWDELDVIITGGENVSSIEVEDCLFQHPAVAEAAVIGVPDEKWGETIKALVVLRPGASATERDLIDHCRGRMAHYKCPTSIELRDALVRTATGKLQKFKLREAYWAGRTRKVN